MGVVKSKEKISQADIVLYLFDANEMEKTELEIIISEVRKANENIIIVANKTDQVSKEGLVNFPDSVFISAKEEIGIEELKTTLFAMAGGAGIKNENIVVTNARHFAALTEVSKSLEDIKSGLENKISGDFLSIDINRCLHYLGEITGTVTNEDRLDYIFSKFCIGK
jgi:tRNA modification GTPase